MATLEGHEQKKGAGLTRRQVLAGGVGAVTAAALTGCQHQPAVGPTEISQRERTGFIDCHSHVWTSDTVRFPLGAWASKDAMSPAEFTAQELLEIANPTGVDRVVLIQHAPYYGYDASYLIACAQNFPGVFSIVGMIDQRQPQLEQRLTQLRDNGIRGIRIGPTKHADRTLISEPLRWLESDGMRDLWKLAASQKIAICPLLESKFLPTLDPMCERNPDTVCVIDHLGHIDPAQPDTVASLLKLARHPNVNVKVSAFYKFGDGQAPYQDLAPWIEPVYDAFGPQRLMWGSDCPYQLQNNNNYADSVALIRDQLEFLSPTDRTAILRDTAERVFFA